MKMKNLNVDMMYICFSVVQLINVLNNYANEKMKFINVEEILEYLETLGYDVNHVSKNPMTKAEMFKVLDKAYKVIKYVKFSETESENNNETINQNENFKVEYLNHDDENVSFDFDFDFCDMEINKSIPNIEIHKRIHKHENENNETLGSIHQDIYNMLSIELSESNSS